MKRNRVVEDDVEPDDDGDDDDDGELDNIDSDDESSDDESTPVILPFAEMISNTCNTMLLFLLSCNYVYLQVFVFYCY